MKKFPGILAEPPSFSADVVEHCTTNGDFCPILFAWYQYTAFVSLSVASLSADSPGIRNLPPIHYAILTGLLNRISRLMRSNVVLSDSGRSGETTQLLDRCIIESAIKVRWLCIKGDAESFRRYIADGIKNDLKLRKQLIGIIESRGGGMSPIESRMLSSIQRMLQLSGMTEQETDDSKKLPDYSSMCRDVGMDDLAYTVLQRMGSHAVHGTFTDLVFHYLENDNGDFTLRGDDVPTRAVQYIGVCLFVLETLHKVLEYVTVDSEDISEFTAILEHIREEIDQIRQRTSVDYELTATQAGEVSKEVR